MAAKKKSRSKKKVAKKIDSNISKADKARAIYKRMKGKPRKDIILAFISEAGLSAAGASTYYQNIKNK